MGIETSAQTTIDNSMPPSVRELTLYLNQRLEQASELRSRSPVEIAVEGVTRDVALTERILGSQHPLVQEYRKEIPKAEKYAAITGSLMEDTRTRWGHIITLDEVNNDTVLRNLSLFDYNRLGLLNTVSSVIDRITTENQAQADGLPFPPVTENDKITLVYEAINNRKKGTYEVSSKFARANLHHYPEKIYQSFTDDRVPFLYLLTNYDAFVSEHLEQTADIFARAYHGELLPFNPRVNRKHREIVLPEDTRKELGKVGAVVFEPYGGSIHVDTVSSKDEKATMNVSLDEIPWITQKNFPKKLLTDWVLPTIVHESQHLTDFRTYDGAPISPTLFEARAFSSQYEFLTKYGAPRSADRVLTYLAPYIQIMKGSFKDTHFEDFYRRNIQSALTRITPEQQQTITSALSH